jgi:fatty acid desaturase
MDNIELFYANERDAREYQYKVIAFTMCLYLVFIAFALGYIPFWIMLPVSSILVTRWLIAFHELLHLKKAEDLDWLTRLVPIPFSLVNLGYREYRQIHMGHHRYTAQREDPDAFHIRGGHLKALLGAITQQEQASYRFIKQYGLSRELAVMLFLRAALFLALLLVFGKVFVVWFLVLRITYIINDYIFFHFVHYRAGQAGTFSIPLTRWLIYAFIVIYGIDVVYATMHHDIHHRNARIAAKFLPHMAGDNISNKA